MFPRNTASISLKRSRAMRRADQRGLEIRRDELHKRGLDTFAVDAALAQPVELGRENLELPGDAEMWVAIESLYEPKSA